MQEVDRIQKGMLQPANMDRMKRKARTKLESSGFFASDVLFLDKKLQPAYEQQVQQMYSLLETDIQIENDDILKIFKGLRPTPELFQKYLSIASERDEPLFSDGYSLQTWTEERGTYKGFKSNDGTRR